MITAKTDAADYYEQLSEHFLERARIAEEFGVARATYRDLFNCAVTLRQCAAKLRSSDRAKKKSKERS